MEQSATIITGSWLGAYAQMIIEKIQEEAFNLACDIILQRGMSDGIPGGLKSAIEQIKADGPPREV